MTDAVDTGESSLIEYSCGAENLGVNELYGRRGRPAEFTEAPSAGRMGAMKPTLLVLAGILAAPHALAAPAPQER